MNVDDFFSYKNTVRDLSHIELEQTSNYLEVVEAFARTSYKSIYVIDYQAKAFEYVSDNPLFLCGHTAKEIKKMGYEYYFKFVPKHDLELLLKINTVGFDFYESIPLKDRKEYSISYDFHIINQEGKSILINQKLTPLFITGTGQIWKSLCVVSLSVERNAGNIKIYRQGDHQIRLYDLEGDFWKADVRAELTRREKELLEYSARGFTIQEISEVIFTSPETVKFHRRKLYEKLEVSNITEAIGYATYNNLI